MSKRNRDTPIRVLIVEDSLAQRELLVGLLQQDDTFQVIGTASNGREAVEKAIALRPDIIAMDIHLPIQDGYAATRQIMQQSPTRIVMVSSSIGTEGVRSVEALTAGALAVIRKPGSMHRSYDQQDRETLLTTLRLMADVPVVTRHAVRRSPAEPAAPAITTVNPQLLAIAASTGGPVAVQLLLKGLGGDFPLPVLLVQHIARGFVSALAQWLDQTLDLTICIAAQGQELQPAHVYLAPEEHHILAASNHSLAIRLNKPQDRYCPSADFLFESVAQAYGKRSIGVVLTGMGDDGAAGMQLLHQTGALTLAQDEASSVVYGMPRAAFERGVITRVESIQNMAPVILQQVQKRH
ncbi:MAG: chemotaxis-specific protein-glutamate methyltransferase CheB [Chloroflexaceae bacterium]|nr:chemotaxis-specific protein-glutamate methyltransferase CheB [Chloroflexaceae bacterium]